MKPILLFFVLASMTSRAGLRVIDGFERDITPGVEAIHRSNLNNAPIYTDRLKIRVSGTQTCSKMRFGDPEYLNPGDFFWKKTVYDTQNKNWIVGFGKMSSLSSYYRLPAPGYAGHCKVEYVANISGYPDENTKWSTEINLTISDVGSMNLGPFALDKPLEALRIVLPSCKNTKVLQVLLETEDHQLITLALNQGMFYDSFSDRTEYTAGFKDVKLIRQIYVKVNSTSSPSCAGRLLLAHY